MNTALITGITGHDGAYLAELLLNKGYRVVGAFRRASTVNTDRLAALGIADEVELVPDLLGYTYALEGLYVVRARPFNHSGPNQSPDFLLPTLVQQFSEIKAGKREPIIHLGNLEPVRDFSDVRDVVRGYHIALQRGRSGEAYNLGSGRGVSVRELFELVSQEAGVEVELVVEPSRVRPTDIPFLVADVSKARKELRWTADIPLEETVRDMFN